MSLQVRPAAPTASRYIAPSRLAASLCTKAWRLSDKHVLVSYIHSRVGKGKSIVRRRVAGQRGPRGARNAWTMHARLRSRVATTR